MVEILRISPKKKKVIFYPRFPPSRYVNTAHGRKNTDFRTKSPRS